VQENAAARSLFENADFEGAERTWLQALRIARGMGATDPRVAETYANLGALYMRTQRYEEAVAMLKGAIRLKQRIYGANSSELACDLINCSKSARMLGEDETADAADLRLERIRLLTESKKVLVDAAPHRTDGASTSVHATLTLPPAARSTNQAQRQTVASYPPGLPQFDSPRSRFVSINRSHELAAVDREMLDWQNQMSNRTLAQQEAIRQAEEGEIRSLETRQRAALIASQWYRMRFVR
jgi:tetratricopeptide (TPR) repeat protein